MCDKIINCGNELYCKILDEIIIALSFVINLPKAGGGGVALINI